MLYLQKSSSDGVCWCRCAPEKARVSVPGDSQLDCPWCGCGWLFSCIVCRKAFTFARAIEVDETAEAIVTADLESFGFEANPAMVRTGAERVRSLSLIEGAEYAILDTQPVPVTEGPLQVLGRYGFHDLADLPQRSWRPAVTDNHQLKLPSYWHAAFAARRARIQ